MIREEAFDKLKEDYILRSMLKKKNLNVQEELEDEIEDLEQSYITSKIIPQIETYAKDLLKDLECEVYLEVLKEANGKVRVENECVVVSLPKLSYESKFHSDAKTYDKIIEHLVLCELRPTDECVHLHVSDELSCNASIIKRKGKYGIFVLGNRSMDGSLPTINMGVENPFIYDDVRIACESSWQGDDMGFVAVKTGNKWGILDVTQNYELDTVVGIRHTKFESAAGEIISIIGRELKSPWMKFHEYDANNMTPIHPTKSAIEITPANIQDVQGRKLRITMDDGTVYEGNISIQTFIMALQHFGLDEVAKVGIKCSGYNLIDTRKRTDGNRKWQQKVDGRWVYVYYSNIQKIIYLFQIAEYLNKNIKIEAI